jgi:hypothetical protein
MSHSRRNFIQSVTLTLLGGAAFPAFAQSAASKTFDPENLILLDGASQQLFEPYIGEKFSVFSEARAVGTMELIAVDGLTPPQQPKGQPVTQVVTAFKLRFRSYGTPLPQDTYTLKNGALGSVSIFLVPSGFKNPPTTYTAIFGLLAQ